MVPGLPPMRASCALSRSTLPLLRHGSETLIQRSRLAVLLLTIVTAQPAHAATDWNLTAEIWKDQLADLYLADAARRFCGGGESAALKSTMRSTIAGLEQALGASPTSCRQGGADQRAGTCGAEWGAEKVLRQFLFDETGELSSAGDAGAPCRRWPQTLTFKHACRPAAPEPHHADASRRSGHCADRRLSDSCHRSHRTCEGGQPAVLGTIRAMRK